MRREGRGAEEAGRGWFQGSSLLVLSELGCRLPLMKARQVWWSGAGGTWEIGWGRKRGRTIVDSTVRINVRYIFLFFRKKF